MSTMAEDRAKLIEFQEKLFTKLDLYMQKMEETVKSIEYPKIPTGDIGTPGSLDELQLKIPEFIWPPRPDINYTAMENVDKYKKHIWEGPFLDQAETLLMGWVKNGGVGISIATQNAIFNQDGERRIQAMQDAMDALSAVHGGRGFRYANSRLDVKQSELAQKYQFDSTDSSRNIVKTMADLAQKNVQFAMTQVSDIEKLHADFSIKYSALYLDVMTHIIETYKADIQAMSIKVNAEIQRATTLLESLRFNNESQYKSAVLTAGVEKDRLLAEIERVKMEIGIVTQTTNYKISAIESSEKVTGEMLKAMGFNSFNIGKAT